METLPASSRELLPGSESARISSRNESEKGTVAKASVRGEPDEKSTRAASAPSRLVPNINPTNSAPTSLEASGRRGAHEVDGRARLAGDLQELRLESRRHGIRLRKSDAQRILVRPRDLEFVVQVRARRIAGHADVPDGLALSHTCSRVDPAGECRQVAIQRSDAAAVPELDGIAIAPAHAHGHDLPVRRREDSRALGRSEVDTGMRTPILEDRMETRAEPGAHAREFHGRAQERLGAIGP